jgi:hypothetical protein
MRKTSEVPTLILYEEAGALARKIEDNILLDFVNYGVTIVLTKRGMDPKIVPQADFDLRFFTEVLRSMGSDQEVLRKILSGNSADLEWWDRER